MKIYLVGGAVRDGLLDLPVTDRDWVVVGASEQEMLDGGFRRADSVFPVFLHPASGEEYALARRETKTDVGHKGFQIDAGPGITLEEDLARRDLTINAMARDEHGVLYDPFGGEDDLRDGRLRHVTPAFAEDPLRILRVARFAACLGEYGFRLAHGTHRLLCEMADRNAVGELPAARVWQETRKAFCCRQPWRYLEVLQASGNLIGLLAPFALLPEREAHGDPIDDPVDSLAVLKRAAAMADAWEVRLIALLLQSQAEAIDLRKLGVEKAAIVLLRAARQTWPHYEAFHVDRSPVDAYQALVAAGAFRHLQRAEEVLAVCSSQLPDGRRDHDLDRCLRAALDVGSAEFLAQGLTGRALGDALDAARRQAIASCLAG